MVIHDFSNKNSLLQVYLSNMRDVNLQKNTYFFTQNLEKIGQFFAYEVANTVSFASKQIQTPLGVKRVSLPNVDFVVASIMRAGLYLHMGILQSLMNAQSCFITPSYSHAEVMAGRQQRLTLSKLPSSNSLERVFVLADPMLATGKSLLQSFHLMEKEVSDFSHSVVHIVVVLASPEGVDVLMKAIPDDRVCLWVLSIDEKLNEKGYIIPGLGDAGDLSFSTI